MSGTPPLPWLAPGDSPALLPEPGEALAEPNGLLAVGGALTPDWLLAAYRRGIFPWFSRGQPILWWSPDPRCVFRPRDFRPNRSLARAMRNRGFELRQDSDFAAVIDGCAAPRADGGGTWITPSMRRAYLELHRLGHAHSYEVWLAGRLVGGLYGVRLGAMFFAESMFRRARDASKVAVAWLMRDALECGIELVDCQVPSAHLSSLGAAVLPRREFLAQVARLTLQSG